MRVLYCLFILFWMISSAAYAQNAYERSLQLYKENKQDSASLHIREAIGQYRQSAKNDSLVFAYTQQAMITWDMVSAEQALTVLDTAFRIAARLPSHHLASVAAYTRAAQICNQQQQFRKAAGYFKHAFLSIPVSDTVNRHIVSLYNNNAIFFLMQDEYDKARPWAQRAYQLNLQLQGKDGTDMPAVLQTIYYISQYSEHYQQALKDGMELQRVMQLHYPPGHRAIGVMHNSLGNIYEALLQYEDALVHRKKAVEIHLRNYLKAKNNGFSLASAYQNLGNLYSYINEHYLAQQYLWRGAAMFEQIYGSDEAGMITILTGVADNKRKLQAYDEAEKLFQRAYSIQQKQAPEDANGLAYVESFYGDLFLSRQQYEKAEELYRLSLQHFKQAGAARTRLALQTEKGLADALSARGNHEAAIIKYKSLLQDFRKLYPKGNDAIADKLQGISEVYLAARRPMEALSFSDSVFTELTGLRKLPADGSWVDKLPFTYNTSLYIVHRMKLLRQLYSNSGKNKQGREVLQLADRYGRFIAIHLPAFRTQASLKELASVHKQLYSIAIETCWQLSGNGNDQSMTELALGYSERSKAFQLRLSSNNLLVDMAADNSNPAALRDHQFRKRIGELNARYLNDAEKSDSVLQLLTASIESYRVFQDSIAKSGNASLAAKYQLDPYPLSDIRTKLLSHGETLVEYTVTDKWVFVFVVNEAVCRMMRADLEVVRNIKPLQELNTLSPEAFVQPAFKLYQALVQPFIPLLQKKRLLIVPDAELYYLNFELLVSENNCRSFTSMPFLIRDYNISYLLSASSAIRLSESQAMPPAGKALLLAPVFTDEMKDLYRQRAVASAEAGDQDYFYLHRQPFAREAVRQIGRLIPNDQFLEQQAQEGLFKQSAAAYRILHLGTHAAVNDMAQQHSRLFFAKALPDDSSSNDDGYLHVYEIYAMQLRADLAVLTACETGAGAIQDGDGVMSLSHSFMYAGCKGVVMSLWKIDEKTSMQIVTAFYDYLARGYAKSEALRQAKLDLLEKQDSKMSHPYYWAGLTLIGDDTPAFRKFSWLYWTSGGALIAAIAGWAWFRRSRRKKEISGCC